MVIKIAPDKFQRDVKWKVMCSDMMHCFIHSLCLYSIFITRHNKWNLIEILHWVSHDETKKPTS